MKSISFFAVLFFIAIVFEFVACEKKPPCEDCGDNNKPPVARAGADQVITLPTDNIMLDGTTSSDPDNNITSYSWTKISGPSIFKISNANAPQTQVTNLVEGAYRFELEVIDAGRLFSRDTVQITVSSAPVNNDPLNIISGPATLTYLSSLSQPKMVIPATAADKLVFAGGYINAGGRWEPTATVDIYNLVNKTWSTAQLSEARYSITVATVGNKIIYAGGYYNNGSSSSRVDIYDAGTNTWSTATLSMPRSQMTSAVAGNKVFFTESGNITNKVEIYDASSNLWSTAVLSEARADMSVIAAGNKVLFAGGYRKYDGFNDSPYDFSTRVDIYDIATNTWSTAELKEARSGMAAGVAGNKVVFAGGYSVTDPVSGLWLVSNRVDIYDATANSWSTHLLNLPRDGMVAATIGNKVLFAGGNANGTLTSRVDIFDAITNQWSAAVLSQTRGVYSTLTIGNKVLFFTGVPNFSRMDIYDASTNAWSAVVLNQGLFAYPIAVGNAVFFGGGIVNAYQYSNNGIFTSHVWKLEF